MAEQDLDRNEAATPYKLARARERGQVAKSADVASAVVFGTAMLYLSAQGWALWRTQFALMRAVLLQGTRLDSTGAALLPLLESMLRSALIDGIPFFAALALASIAGNVLQTGAVLSFHPLKPDWSRINPVAGFKRIVSMRMLFQALRACLKLLLLSVAAYLTLKHLTPQFFYLASLPPVGVVRIMFDDLAALGLRVTLMLAFIAVLDSMYMRREFAKNMRMSKREMKDEHKHREGDPRIRGRLRELRRELLKRTRAVSNTRDADVLITNPSHVAVALRYMHGEMRSPELVAKGSGAIAAAMRLIARRHAVPIVRNVPLARALYRELALEESVPPKYYAQVARIVVWVFAMRDAKARGRASEAARA